MNTRENEDQTIQILTDQRMELNKDFRETFSFENYL